MAADYPTVIVKISSEWSSRTLTASEDDAFFFANAIEEETLYWTSRHGWFTQAMKEICHVYDVTCLSFLDPEPWNSPHGCCFFVLDLLMLEDIVASIERLLFFFNADPAKLLAMRLNSRDFTGEDVVVRLKDAKGAWWHGGINISDVLDLISCLNILLSLCVRAREHRCHVLFAQWDS